MRRRVCGAHIPRDAPVLGTGQARPHQPNGGVAPTVRLVATAGATVCWRRTQSWRCPLPTLSDREVLTELDEHMQSFVRRQEMMFVATGEPDDGHDCTFVTGGPGFVRVLGANRLAWPEFDDLSLSTPVSDIQRDPHISLLFVDFARGAIGLHVSGQAKVLDDDAMRRAYRRLNLDPLLDLVADRRPARWITVYVEEAFLSAAGELD
ncbi:pyridoxamine 5'-phosphate oxidase family protein [Dactylosporangium sp. NPDC049140]|uniref:pyridoxamine 5'-phosphate oxidase family protein n=1 Tax=Dactylosporangium sp. NPDC049140 TaxID=3155647 RepID=UPI0033FE4C35